MSPLVHSLSVMLLCSLHSASVAQSPDYSTLTMFFTANATVHSTVRASSSSPDNRSTTPDQSEAGPANATVSLGSSPAAQSETPPDGNPLPAGRTEAPEIGTGNAAAQPGSPTAEPRPTVAPHGPEDTPPPASPSGEPGVPSTTLTGTPASTAREMEHVSCEPPIAPGQNNPEAEKKRQSGKTLGLFVGLAVVLLLVFGLVYLIYNRTQKDDPFSHQRLYNSDPVLSLDVSVEPADRFYGSLIPDLGRVGQGDHVTSQRALNQAAGEVKAPVSQPQTRDEIQLKPMSESSVKIFL
ncbi:uncharacterized protein LOC144669511 [Cetorhinus maximus]